MAGSQVEMVSQTAVNIHILEPDSHCRWEGSSPKGGTGVSGIYPCFFPLVVKAT